MMFLVDTSVLSQFAPGRAPLSEESLTWSLENEHRWHVPSIAAMEIEQGIAKLARLGGVRRAADLALWFTGFLERFTDRIVDLDVEAARRAGAITDRLVAAGRSVSTADVLMGAMAEVRGYGVLTRNLKHFDNIGVPAFDPFTSDRTRFPA
jgi:predicted nucleic acid-binding protein